MRVDVDPFRHRVRLNKGSDDGVFKGQPVLDAFGIVGQIASVDKYTSIMILINHTQTLIGLFTFLALLATLANLVPYLFCAMAALRLAIAPAIPRRRALPSPPIHRHF